MSQCSDGPERRDGRDDAEEDVTDDGKVRGCDKVGVPLVITAYHDQAALGYAVRYEDVHDGLVPRPRIEGCKGVWKKKGHLFPGQKDGVSVFRLHDKIS